MRFVQRTPRWTTIFTDTGPQLTLGDESGRSVKWRHGSRGSRVEGVDISPARVSYFVGQDPKRWRTNVAVYDRVRYRDVAPGIDIVYYEQPDGLEFGSLQPFRESARGT